jgi:hypothetical protein
LERPWVQTDAGPDRAADVADVVALELLTEPDEDDAV